MTRQWWAKNEVGQELDVEIQNARMIRGRHCKNLTRNEDLVTAITQGDCNWIEKDLCTQQKKNRYGKS